MKKFLQIASLALVVVLSLAIFVACAPNSDPNKAIEALKKNDYAAAKDTVVVPIALKLLGVNCDSVVTGTKTVGEGEDAKIEHVTIIYFTSADEAKSAWDKVKSYAEDKDENKNDSDWTIKQSGAMIYYGTSAAIKAAR